MQHGKALWWVILAIVVLILVFGYFFVFVRKSSSEIDIKAFKQLIQGAECADIANELYAIDGQMVFWDRQGNCADAGYGYALYGTAPKIVLCSQSDSIAGPVTSCPDEKNKQIFDTILSNLTKPDLGLGPSHTVVRVQ